MSRSLEAVIEELKQALPYVARDAERYRNPSELVTKSHKLHLAERAIKETLPYPSLAPGRPVIRLRVGPLAIEGYRLRKKVYDMTETEMGLARPGEEHDLRYAARLRTDTFNRNPEYTQTIFGQLMYFDLATIGRTLEDGGDLSVSE